MRKTTKSERVIKSATNLEEKTEPFTDIEICVNQTWPQKEQYFNLKLRCLPGDFIPCSNHDCDGQFSVWSIIDRMRSGKKATVVGRMMCRGTEKLMGDRKCANFFNYKISVAYKPLPQA